MDDTQLQQAIKDSNALMYDVKEYFKWNWTLITDMFKSGKTFSKRRLEQGNTSRFLRRVLSFLSPQSVAFHTLPFDGDNHLYGELGIKLFTELSECDDCLKLIAGHGILSEIELLLVDLDNQTGAISATNVASRMVAYYFDFIGILCRTPAGQQVLADCRMFTCMYAMCERSDRDDLLQILLKKLPWNVGGHPNIIITQMLTSVNVQMRRYATDTLRNLMRMEVKLRRSQWAVATLIRQVYDADPELQVKALKILDEMCEEPEVLSVVIQQEPAILHLKDAGVMFLNRLLSHEQGLHYLNSCGYISRELDDWFFIKNVEYARDVDLQLTTVLTGKSARRAPSANNTSLIPVHLYGQLCRLQPGADALKVITYISVGIFSLTSTENRAY